MNKQSTLIKPGQEGSFMDALQKSYFHRDSEATNHVIQALNSFVAYPQSKRDEVIQAFTVKGDMPELTTRLPYVNLQLPNYDMSYEPAFRLATLDSVNGQTKLSWEIMTGSNNIVFQEMAEGQAPVISGFEGEIRRVSCKRYSGALGWTDELIRDRNISILIDRSEMFRASFYKVKADVYYRLLRLASEQETAITWQTTTETVGVTLDRDRKTINEACFQLGNKTKDKGYGDTSNASFLLYLNPGMRSRMTQALSQNSVVNATRIEYNVTPIFTFNSNLPTNAQHGILVLPGHKIQRADAMLPTTFLETNVKSMTYEEYVHAYYGGVVADTDQTLGVRFA